VHAGAGIRAGIDHPGDFVSGIELPAAVRDSLANDLQPGRLN
jgi:hypothetical protein